MGCNMTTTTTTTTTQTAKPQSSFSAEVQATIGLLAAFDGLLTRETSALRAVDFATVDSLQEQKREFAKNYHEQIMALSARQSEIGSLDPALREKLLRARTAFTVTLKDNLRALESAKDGAKRLVDRILDIARRTVADECQTSYSAKGHAQTYKTSTLSLRVDQQL